MNTRVTCVLTLLMIFAIAARPCMAQTPAPGPAERKQQMIDNWAERIAQPPLAEAYLRQWFELARPDEATRTRVAQAYEAYRAEHVQLARTHMQEVRRIADDLEKRWQEEPWYSGSTTLPFDWQQESWRIEVAVVAAITDIVGDDEQQLEALQSVLRTSHRERWLPNLLIGEPSKWCVDMLAALSEIELPNDERAELATVLYDYERALDHTLITFHEQMPIVNKKLSAIPNDDPNRADMAEVYFRLFTDVADEGRLWYPVIVAGLPPRYARLFSDAVQRKRYPDLYRPSLVDVACRALLNWTGLPDADRAAVQKLYDEYTQAATDLRDALIVEVNRYWAVRDHSPDDDPDNDPSAKIMMQRRTFELRTLRELAATVQHISTDSTFPASTRLMIDIAGER